MSHHACGQGSGDSDQFSMQDWINYITEFVEHAFCKYKQAGDRLASEESATVETTPFVSSPEPRLNDNDRNDWMSDISLPVTPDNTFYLAPFGSNYGMKDYLGLLGGYTVYQDDGSVLDFKVGWAHVAAGGTGPLGRAAFNDSTTEGYFIDTRYGPKYVEGTTIREPVSSDMFYFELNWSF